MSDPGRVFGRGIGFPPQVGPDGRVAWSEGEVNVRESIRIILSTEPGERVRLPDFGGGLAIFLFEPNTVATRCQIQERIVRALSSWEPRITNLSVSVEPDPADTQAAIAAVTYQLVANQVLERVSVTIAFAG